MARHQIQEEKECLGRIIQNLKKNHPQLVKGLHTESNKIRYLCNDTLGKKQTKTPLADIYTAQYNFYYLVMPFNEGIQLEREVEKAGSSSTTYYG